MDKKVEGSSASNRPPPASRGLQLPEGCSKPRGRWKGRQQCTPKSRKIWPPDNPLSTFRNQWGEASLAGRNSVRESTPEEVPDSRRTCRSPFALACDRKSACGVERDQDTLGVGGDRLPPDLVGVLRHRTGQSFRMAVGGFCRSFEEAGDHSLLLFGEALLYTPHLVDIGPQVRQRVVSRFLCLAHDCASAVIGIRRSFGRTSTSRASAPCGANARSKNG